MAKSSYIQDIKTPTDKVQDNEELDNKNGGAGDIVPEFLSVFQGKTYFDSWEEFNSLFKEFQRITGTVFRPKNPQTIEYANKKRVKDKIPAKFVYASLKMACHMSMKTGLLDKSLNSSDECKAHVNLSYCKGKLHITTYDFKHSNHSLSCQLSKTVPFREFCFTPKLDLLLCQEILKKNPFQQLRSMIANKKWSEVVESLREKDNLLKDVTQRMLKKRISMLLSAFKNKNSDVLSPSDLALHNAVFEVLQIKERADLQYHYTFSPRRLPNKSNINKTCEIKNSKTYGISGDLFKDPQKEDSTTVAVIEQAELDSIQPPIHETPKKRKRSYGQRQQDFIPKDRENKGSNLKQASVSSLLAFMQNKQLADRELRQAELELAHQEMQLAREINLQRERFHEELFLIEEQMNQKFEAIKDDLIAESDLWTINLETFVNQGIMEALANDQNI